MAPKINQQFTSKIENKWYQRSISGSEAKLSTKYAKDPSAVQRHKSWQNSNYNLL
jgi:hypothetical protein